MFGNVRAGGTCDLFVCGHIIGKQHKPSAVMLRYRYIQTRGQYGSGSDPRLAIHTEPLATAMETVKENIGKSPQLVRYNGPATRSSQHWYRASLSGYGLALNCAIKHRLVSSASFARTATITATIVDSTMHPSRARNTSDGSN